MTLKTERVTYSMGINNDSRLCLGVKLEGSEEEDDYSYNSCDVLILYRFLEKRGIAFEPSEYSYEGETDEDSDEYPELDDFAKAVSRDWEEILELVNKELKKTKSNFRVRHACPTCDCEPLYITFYLNYKEVEDSWEHEGISLEEARTALAEMNVKEMNDLLQEFGLEEKEPRLFSLPHVD